MLPWLRLENDMQKMFDLESTPGSGNQWHSPSDGVTTGYYTEAAWPLMIDAKHTTQKGYRVVRKLMDQWVVTARAAGKHFALPIRFEEPGGFASDYVVIPTDDYAELVGHITEEPVPPERLTDGEMKFLEKIAEALTQPEAQREFYAIVAKIEAGR